MKLREFIDRNRKDFDEVPLPLGHERRFEQRLEKRKQKFGKWPLLGIAATLAALVILNITVSDSSQNRNSSPTLKTGIGIFDIENFYQAQMEVTQDRIGPPLPEGKDSLLGKHLEALEEKYNSLKIQLEQSPNDERIMQLMVDNYRLRLELLELHLKQINSQKNHK